MVVLVTMGATLAIAVIDSVGQTIYSRMVDGNLKAWAASIGGAIAGLAAGGRQLVVLLGAKPGGKRPPLPLSIVGTVVALLLVSTMLLGANLLSHAIAWDFAMPRSPAQITPSSSGLKIEAHALRWSVIATGEGTESESRTPGDRSSGIPFGLWIFGAAVLTYAFGRNFNFLNYSTYQALYSARLTRAYLGASNSRRWVDSCAPVTEPIVDDDIEVHKYWPVPSSGDVWTIYDKGAPLHLVNVTINETFSGASQVQQQDRKGIGMALGPAGISAGVRHHAVYAPDAIRDETPDDAFHPGAREIAAVYPKDGEGKPAFRVFEFGEHPPKEFPEEPLSLGRWTGISGAAFSTGIGYRTSLGLSLLAGLANVRLGYWWNSGVDVRRRMNDCGKPREGLARYYTWLLPVHTFLLYEMSAHFPGTSRRHWYLSDGGHFENLGGYELIRRRLPLIIVIDAEADDDYTFEGLGNLVRKARLDFGAEITFRPAATQSADSNRPQADPLRDLRASKSGGDLEPRRSRAHFAIADIDYAPGTPGGPKGVMVYLKPTLTGDEPVDVREYARHNVPFPQQTTADQFFDEAQWESYRKLGEHIADDVLSSGDWKQIGG
jgi:hypothetical protein